MNEDILKGTWKTLEGEAKIWWGKKNDAPLTVLDGNKDKIAGWLQMNLGMTVEKAESEIKKLSFIKKEMEVRSEEVKKKLLAQFDKLSTNDLAEIDGNVEAWANKVKEKYNCSQEQAQSKIKNFIAQFEKK